MEKPLIITMGDPTGVGPEIIVKALLESRLDVISSPLIVAGDLAVLQRAARLYGVEAMVYGDALSLSGKSIQVMNLSELAAESLVYGAPDTACGVAMARYVDWAAEQCLAGRAAGLVTAPINKKAINDAGIEFPGHTELLADRCDVGKVVMMLAGKRLRVSLVTTHLALADVPEQLDRDRIVSTIRITEEALRSRFGIARPHLAVLALNPHAGEAGLFGREEEEIIAPAIKQARAEGIDASGPHSADTFFHFAAAGQYDAVICMYHDQGLIPLKLLHFEDGVNITLGLPIVRTSVDHGTAYDLAGTGKASCASLVAAIRMAEEMVGMRN
ncbi:MAG: 4-hydroxythreonine-4-phosphate dehydrogenase PdxA [Desulfuromonas sp.]|nr:MAG: 4-hydroxythreonine-4-phosphate dehydrogenase PdxA [Desulfuromonas sp.]